MTKADRIWMAVAAGLLLVGLTACGDDGDEATDSSDATDEAMATDELADDGGAEGDDGAEDDGSTDESAATADLDPYEVDPCVLEPAQLQTLRDLNAPVTGHPSGTIGAGTPDEGPGLNSCSYPVAHNDPGQPDSTFSLIAVSSERDIVCFVEHRGVCVAPGTTFGDVDHGLRGPRRDRTSGEGPPRRPMR